MTAATVLVVDDHPLVSEGLRALLESGGITAEVSACESADGIIAEVTANRPAAVILDLDLQGAGDGEALIRPLVQLGARVMVLSAAAPHLKVARCVEAGASAVSFKGENVPQLVENVRALIEGRPLMSDAARARCLTDLDEGRRRERTAQAPFAQLTRAEQTVLVQMIDGRRAEDIATTNWVSLTTVRTQIRSILKKLAVSSQLEAVALAHQIRWAPTEGVSR
jgi:two-component system nitrate/nitrite response regulator NarL